MNAEHKDRIGVLIVTWNRRADVLECIRSVSASDYRRLTTMVVDNASTDDTSDAIRSAHPDVRVIRSDTNLGFAAGSNLGLNVMLQEHTDGILLLNDDALVDVGTIGLLAHAMDEDAQVGVVAPKVLIHSHPDLIWSAGGLVDASGVATQRFYAEPDDGRADEPADVDYAIGCAMLARTNVIRQVGLLDPRYYTYYEETDWCMRIRRAGYRIRYVPGSKVWHKVQIGDNNRNSSAYYCSRNRLLYLDGISASGRTIWTAVSDILRSAAVHAVRGRTHESRMMVKAVADYYSRTFGRLGDLS